MSSGGSAGFAKRMVYAVALVLAGFLLGRLSKDGPVETVAPVAGQETKAVVPAPVSARAPEVVTPPVVKEQKPVSRKFTALDFSKEQAGEAWNRAMSAKDEDQKRMNLQLVVTRMCKLGMAEEAIEKITSSFGAGKTRSYLVGVSFMFTQPSQVAEAYARLEYEDEKLSARDGLGYGMGDTLVRARSPFAFDVSTMGFSTQESNEILTKCVERYVMGMYAQSPSDTAGMVEAVFSTPMSDQAKLASLSAVSQFVPFEAWDQLAKVTTGDKTATSEMLMRRMISRDPGKAVDKMVSSPTATKYLAPGFHAWMAADATRPITWLEENKGRISPVQRDAALQGITKFALDHKEYDVASQWANQIENPSDRAAVLKEVEKIANTAKNK